MKSGLQPNELELLAPQPPANQRCIEAASASAGGAPVVNRHESNVQQRTSFASPHDDLIAA
jgi:hypothetical protein